MQYFVNLGLLFSFLTLAISGCLSYWQPFSVVTTRIHLLFGGLTFVLVGLHLAARVSYFRRWLVTPPKRSFGWKGLASVAGVWMLFLWGAVANWEPARGVMGLSYESRQRATIVRSSPLAGIARSSDELLVSRVPGGEADVSVSLLVRLADDLPATPAIAVWAETASGSMIETLYLNEALAYSESPEWNGRRTPRHRILPIWRHRYTLVSKVNYQGKADAVSGATKSHQFTLDRHLKRGEDQSFVLCVEVNLPGDPNDEFPDPHLGQPSVLYTALISADAEERYVLLEQTGHGGGAETSGAIQYDLERVSSGKKILDLALVRIEFL